MIVKKRKKCSRRRTARRKRREQQEDEDACKGDKSPQQGSASKAGKSRKKHKKKLIKIRRQKVSEQDVAVQSFNSMKSVPITKPKKDKERRYRAATTARQFLFLFLKNWSKSQNKKATKKQQSITEKRRTF